MGLKLLKNEVTQFSEQEFKNVYVFERSFFFLFFWQEAMKSGNIALYLQSSGLGNVCFYKQNSIGC